MIARSDVGMKQKTATLSTNVLAIDDSCIVLI